MTPSLLLVGAAVAVLAVIAVRRVIRSRTLPALLQLLGTVFLIVVVLAHVAEALGLFPAMGWGRPGTVGHYLDLTSAIAGLTLWLVGYVLWRLRQPVSG